MAVEKLSQFPVSGLPPTPADGIVGVTAGNVDVLFTLPQIASSTIIGQGYINIGYYVPLVADGLTDNRAAFEAFAGQGLHPGDAYGGAGVCKTIGLSLPTVVTFTLASPGVVNWTGHGLRVNETVVFATTGALPTGLVAGTPYYVMYANLTANSFQVSAQNAIVNRTGDGPAVNFTGSQSGTQYARTRATDWQDVVLLPGAYHESSNVSINGDQRKLRFSGYGAVADNISFASPLRLGAGHGGYDVFSHLYESALAQSGGGGGVSVAVLDTSVAVINTSDTAKFWVGGWILIGALDLQNSFGVELSYPPNNHYFEFAQVIAVNAGTGKLTLSAPVRSTYNLGYPLFYSGSDNVGPAGGGPATIWPMSPSWDMEQEIRGLHITNLGFQTPTTCRSIRFVDCQFDGQGPVPSATRSFIMEDCILTQNGILEIDKLVERILFRNVDFTIGGFEVQSSSVDRLVVDGCSMINLTGTAKINHITDSYISVLSLGVIAFGATELVYLDNCRISLLQESVPFEETTAGGALEFAYCINNWTFNNGTLSQPLVSTIANSWAVPGRTMYINDMAQNFDSMGSPFVVIDVYQTTAANSVVTIDIASPAVVHWAAHGRSAGDVIYFTTTGALPAGLLAYVPYYVLAAGLTSGTFELSATLGGSAINTSGSQSGTQTAFANPVFNIDTTLPALPVGISTSSTVTIDIASPAVIHWTAHGLVAGTPVIFQTTGLLPTGLSTTQLFYVIAAGLTANSFEVSTSVGGAAVNTSGSQSGTQTAISNPLKFKTVACPAVTVKNCTGCPQIVDLTGAPDNIALWSYGSRKFAGNPGVNPSYFEPSIRLRGYLVSLTINVEKAYTGGGSYTFSIAAQAFTTALIEQDMSFVINANIAGKRVVTPAGVTGAQAGDTLSAFGNWISAGPNANSAAAHLTITPTIPGGNLATWPIVEFEFLTDQGDVRSGVWQIGSNQSGHSDQLFNTSSYHGYL